mmetsp:Transcript_18894/g.27262  ORF Transcript_18894/g.27262 Transcript_18894/m.27262 type:complete len:112 (+) Transcript_18894:866-1201(+)
MPAGRDTQNSLRRMIHEGLRLHVPYPREAFAQCLERPVCVPLAVKLLTRPTNVSTLCGKDAVNKFKANDDSLIADLSDYRESETYKESLQRSEANKWKEARQSERNVLFLT